VDRVKDSRGLPVPSLCPVLPMIGALVRGAVANASHGGMFPRMRKMIHQQLDRDYVNGYVKVILMMVLVLVVVMVLVCMVICLMRLRKVWVG
jgi:heme/copper-type cytochrome/quinol oxidase subunit 2